MDFDVDIAAIGYPAVRHAFNETLQLCAEQLSKAELKLAQEILGLAAPGEAAPGVIEMLADTALYSRKGVPGARVRARRAIDRIAPKLLFKRDSLQSVIAAHLPTAIFSVCTVEAAHGQGSVLARDLLDDGRVVPIMDHALTAQAARHGEILIAGRFLDLGPWHIGFGIVLPLRKSQALAISLALSNEGDLEARRGSLHELLYPAHLHGADLVMTALEPVIASVALAIDAGMIDVEHLAVGLGSLLSGKPAPKRKRKAIAP